MATRGVHTSLCVILIEMHFLCFLTSSLQILLTNGLARSKPSLSKGTLTAIFTLSLRWVRHKGEDYSFHSSEWRG